MHDLYRGLYGQSVEHRRERLDGNVPPDFPHARRHRHRQFRTGIEPSPLWRSAPAIVLPHELCNGKFDEPRYGETGSRDGGRTEGLSIMLAMTATRRVILAIAALAARSEEHTSELQSLMRISYAVFCLKKKKQKNNSEHTKSTTTI